MPEWKGLFYTTHPEVYEPSDDTFLLADAVAETVRPGMRFLEVGCGTGIVSLVAARAGADVTSADLNPRAVELARHHGKQNGLDLEAIEADLLDGLDGPFDIVAFNPPYLPTAPEDMVEGPLNLAFDGGRDGNETVLRFAAQLAGLVPLPSEVLVVHSSLSDPAPLDEALGDLGYGMEVVRKEKHFFETLTVRRYRLPR